MNKDIRSLNSLEDIEFAIKRIDELELEVKILREALEIYERERILVKELFRLLEITEQTDDGRLFRPNQIYSRRVLDAEKLEKVLAELKRTLEDWDIDQ